MHHLKITFLAERELVIRVTSAAHRTAKQRLKYSLRFYASNQVKAIAAERKLIAIPEKENHPVG